MGIDELELSVRASNLLRRAGITTVADLLALDVSTLTASAGWPRRYVREVEEVRAFLARPTTAPSCDNCRFFRKGEPGYKFGDCHRLPPQFNFSATFATDGYYEPARYKAEISRFQNGVWPSVSKDEWCGEHQPREAE